MAQYEEVNVQTLLKTVKVIFRGECFVQVRLLSSSISVLISKRDRNHPVRHSVPRRVAAATYSLILGWLTINSLTPSGPRELCGLARLSASAVVLCQTGRDRSCLLC